MEHSSSQRARSSAAALGLFGSSGALYFVATFVAMHFIQPELSPIDHHGSEYANGRLGWLMVLGFLVLGGGTVALALGLRRSLAPGKRVLISVVLLAVVGLGFIGAGVFKTDIPLDDGTVGYTLSGKAHALSSFVSFLSLFVATFFLTGVFARDARWRPFAGRARLFAWSLPILCAVTLASTIAGPPGTGGVGGLTQRVFVAVLALWLFVLGLRLRRLGDRAERS